MYIEEFNEEINSTEWRGLDESVLATTGDLITVHTPELGLFEVFQNTRLSDLAQVWITLVGDYNIRIDAENSRTKYTGVIQQFYFTLKLRCKVMYVTSKPLDQLTYIIK